MSNALPVLTCEHDRYSSFYWILTTVKWFEECKNLCQFRKWAIQLKRSGNGEGKKISFNSVTIDDRKKHQLVKLVSIYAQKLLCLKFLDRYNCLEFIG